MIVLVLNAEGAAQMLLLKSELSPVSQRNYQQAEQAVQLSGYDGGAEKHSEHAAVDRMPQHSVWTGADQLMINFLCDGATPISSEVFPGPDCQQARAHLYRQTNRHRI